MIGGKIIEVLHERDRVRIWVVDGYDEAVIYVKPDPTMPVCGNSVWWQMGFAYWTSSDREIEDAKLVKIGNSFDPHRVLS